MWLEKDTNSRTLSIHILKAVIIIIIIIDSLFVQTKLPISNERNDKIYLTSFNTFTQLYFSFTRWYTRVEGIVRNEKVYNTVDKRFILRWSMIAERKLAHSLLYFYSSPHLRHNESLTRYFFPVYMWMCCCVYIAEYISTITDKSLFAKH